MFRRLIDDAKGEAGHIVSALAARVAIGLLFLVAFCFGIVATTMMLIERVGLLTALCAMAGALALLGVVAMGLANYHDSAANVRSEAEAHHGGSAQTSAEAPSVVPLLSGLASMPGGVTLALAVAKLLGRNYALVLFTVVVGTLLWPNRAEADGAQGAENDNEKTSVEA